MDQQAGGAAGGGRGLEVGPGDVQLHRVEPPARDVGGRVGRRGRPGPALQGHADLDGQGADGVPFGVHEAPAADVQRPNDVMALVCCIGAGPVRG